LELVKNAVNKNLRIPDNMILIYPITELNIEADDEEIIIDIDGLQEGYNEIKFRPEIKSSDFYTTEPDVLSKFPDTFIISPTNSPFKESSERLYKYLCTNKVLTTFKQDISYNRFCLQYPSLFENKSPTDYAFGYLVEALKSDNERRMSNLSTVPNSP
jgi:hypothetical protein